MSAVSHPDVVPERVKALFLEDARHEEAQALQLQLGGLCGFSGSVIVL